MPRIPSYGPLASGCTVTAHSLPQLACGRSKEGSPGPPDACTLLTLLTHQSLFVAAGFGAVLPGGVVAAVTSHPFDTVKTRLQAGAPLASAANPATLWRGLLSPVLVVPPGACTSLSACGF